MWRFQVAAFRDRFRCVAWDHRGQGRSELTEGGYDMDTLADDAAALIAQLGIAPVHFVGLSMGGFVGMRLAADLDPTPVIDSDFQAGRSDLWIR